VASRQQSSTCDSCGLPFDTVLRHVPLRDGAWICWYCLRHEAVQRQYAPRLAVNLKGSGNVELPRHYRARPLSSRRPCGLGRMCMNAEGGTPARALKGQKYCSEACRGRAQFYKLHPEKMAAARMVQV
jgi:hypothetical protein